MKGAFGAREGRRGGSGAPASPGLTSSNGNFSPLARRVPVPVRRRERPGKPAAEAPTLAPSSVVEEEEEELEGGGGANCRIDATEAALRLRVDSVGSLCQGAEGNGKTNAARAGATDTEFSANRQLEGRAGASEGGDVTGVSSGPWTTHALCRLGRFATP